MGFVLREAVVTYRPGRKVDAQRRITSSRVVNGILHAGGLDGIGVVAKGDVERFAALALDAKNNVVGWAVIAQGGQSSCAVGVQDLFRWALLAGALAVIVIHNHPSGDPAPSRDDIALTERLVSAGQLIGVGVLDHVIATANGDYFSFLDAGLLTRAGGAR